MSNVLIPEYLDINYNTIVDALKEQLADSEVFKDYNYEGSNIAVLIELMAYIGELNTFFLNKVAKNVFVETVDIYENANRLARQEGYEAKGYVSSRTTLTVVVSADNGADGLNYIDNDILYIPAWHNIDSTKTYDGSTISFVTIDSQTITASGSTVTISVPVVQGTVVELSYTGKDMVDNTLTLPDYKYAFDNNLDDEFSPIELKVNDIIWARISDWYDEIGALAEEDNVYMMRYDKYQRTTIVFNSSRNVPEDSDEISITSLKSLGSNGNVAKSTITIPNSEFVKNTTNTSVGPNEDGWISNSTITVTNAEASTGGADPEDVEELKENAQRVHNTQYRNVVKSDYKTNLETRSDVECAHAWGEKDIAPSGDILEYNKVHIAVIPPNDPSEWETGTINTSANIWTPDGSSISASIVIPTEYVSSYTSELEEFLEPRKMLNAYEEWNLPELVYFSFTLGVRLYRLYEFADVSVDLKNKLIYYFNSTNRDFYDIIDFKDLHEYLIDTTEISSTDNFDSIKGIRNLIIRDIDCRNTIYEPNVIGNYPQYTVSSYSSDVENQLRPIQLGFNQFPVLCSDTVSIVEET
jgi:hypothetical protein